MCAKHLVGEHRHVLDLAHHKLLCVCQACALLFAPQGANKNKYRLIPQRCLALLDFQITDEQWNELMLPVNMAYIFRSSETGQMMAFYPSPAGATESLLNLEHWKTLLQANPMLDEMETDVEALLINRIEQQGAYYIVPIDVCYRLVGLLRASWRGFSGGKEVWESIAAFFAELDTQASPATTLNKKSMYQSDQESQNPKGEGNGRA